MCFEDAGSVDVAGKISRLQRVLVLIQTLFGVSGPASIMSLFINMPLLQISGAEKCLRKAAGGLETSESFASGDKAPTGRCSRCLGNFHVLGNMKKSIGKTMVDSETGKPAGQRRVAMLPRAVHLQRCRMPGWHDRCPRYRLWSVSDMARFKDLWKQLEFQKIHQH